MRRKPKEILGGRYLGCTGGKVVPPLGLWRSPVAHLVRIEGVRGSNPLSSTAFFQARWHVGRATELAIDHLSANCPQCTALDARGLTGPLLATACRSRHGCLRPTCRLVD
jgi:hypothetical protein